jgi:hypothetical protein
LDKSWVVGDTSTTFGRTPNFTPKAELQNNGRTRRHSGPIHFLMG